MQKQVERLATILANTPAYDRMRRDWFQIHMHVINLLDIDDGSSTSAGGEGHSDIDTEDDLQSGHGNFDYDQIAAVVMDTVFVGAMKGAGKGRNNGTDCTVP